MIYIKLLFFIVVLWLYCKFINKTYKPNIDIVIYDKYIYIVYFNYKTSEFEGHEKLFTINLKPFINK
jgi:hypothetical protein